MTDDQPMLLPILSELPFVDLKGLYHKFNYDSFRKEAV